MTLRASKREATARDIKAAARRLFLEQGFESTTMDQVAAAAGVSRASLFNYFPGKSVLLDALGADLESRLVQAVDHYRSKYPHPEEALEQLFSHAGRVLEQTAGVTRLLFMHGSDGQGFPRLLNAFAELARAGQSRTGESRTGESRTGESRTGESRTGGSRGRWRRDLDADQLAEVLYLGFVAGLLDWCVSATTGDRATLLRRRALGLNRLLAG